MDDTDRRLLVFLSAEPRISIQELSKKLGISRQATHRRMHDLTEAGIIRGTKAGVSIPYVDAVPVGVFGKSRARSIEKTLDRLGKSDCTRKVDVATDGQLYVTGYLKDVSQLDNYVGFVKREADMPDPTVGIMGSDEDLLKYPVFGSGRRGRSYRELSPLDLRIVAAMKDDARKPVGEIADMLGVTANTVKRHMEKMMSDGSLDLSAPGIDPALGGDLFFIMQVRIRDDADKHEVARRFLSKQLFLDQFVRTIRNYPNVFFWIFWSGDMRKIRSVMKEICDDHDVVSTELNLVYDGRTYSTWQDLLPLELNSPSAGTGKRGRTSVKGRA